VIIQFLILVAGLGGLCMLSAGMRSWLSSVVSGLQAVARDRRDRSGEHSHG